MIRTSVEEMFFPNYSQEIRFGALSLSGQGQAAYGGCSVEFKNSAVAARATAFDSPLFTFVKNHGIGLTKAVPPGYRATWEDRSKLAAAKLGLKAAGVPHSEYADLLLPPSTGLESDCMEVHIHGPLSRNSISMVHMIAAKRREDRALQKVAMNSLKAAAISAEIE
jgi:hypothetical protein